MKIQEIIDPINNHRTKMKCFYCHGSRIDYDETCLQCGGKGKTWDDDSYIDDDDEDKFENNGDDHNYSQNNKQISEEQHEVVADERYLYNSVEYIINTLRYDDYDDIKLWERFYFLGDHYKNFNIKFPNISKVLDKHKTGLLQMLLSYIKNDYSDMNIDYVFCYIVALKKLGATWPELDIIDKSIIHDANKKLSINENTSNGVVWNFSRMNPFHWAHRNLILTMIKEAKKRNYDWRLFVSSKHEPEKNPLTYEQKIYWIKKLCPEVVGHLVEDPTIKTPLVAATALYRDGYRASVFVAGEDDMPAYSAMITNGNNHGKTHPELLSQGKAFLFNPSDFVISARLTSATNVRKTVADNNPVEFAKAILGPNYNKTNKLMINDIETNMFNDVKNGMTLLTKLYRK